jgi:folate-binding protein YgfZ
MSTDPAAPVPPAVAVPGRYRVLAVRGRDAAAFLQGQLTRDVEALDAAELGLAALLTPQGRVIATPWLARAADGYDLVLPAPLAPPLRERLQRFVLRAKVTLALAAPDAALEERLTARVGAAPTAGARYALALVRAGLPEIGVEASEEWIPQMLNLDLVGAISFQKGCYTGQEIVARTQHLGRIKRRMFRLALDGAPPAVKGALVADGAKAGEVVLAAAADGGAECLVVLNLDARERALALADGRECRMLPLPYPVP